MGAAAAHAGERDSDLELLRESTRGFLTRNYGLDRVRAVLETPRVHDAESWRTAAQLGWIGAALPEERGGAGGDLLDLAVITEELGRAVFPGPSLGCTLGATLLAAADDERGAELAAGIARGEITAAWCLVEEAGDWRPEAVALPATPGDAGFRLSGTKMYVLDADVADVLLVTARAPDGLATFAVAADAPGVAIQVHAGLDLTRRVATIRFDDVDPGQPHELTDEAIVATARLGTLLTVADTIGAAGRLMEMTVDYALSRRTFGKPIASYQAIKHKCADMLCWVEGSRAAARYAAEELLAGSPGAARAVSIAKSYASDVCSRLAGEALQIHGGIGFTWEHDLHLYLRRIKANEVLFGGIADHRAEIAAALA